MAGTYTSIGEYLKKEFGEKVVKLSLDGGFTCPNRDGSCGTGGCIFCSSDGSGEFAGSMDEEIRLLSRKWPVGKYIAYFQNHTNTYAPVRELREKFEAALAYDFSDYDYEAAGLERKPEIVGLAIATRPDCLPDDVLDLLSELNEKTFLWVELGLQSVSDETGRTINRGYDFEVFDRAMKELEKRGIKTVVHLIFGLPKRIENGAVIPETRAEMLQSVKTVCAYRPFGIKFHMLNVVKGSQMETLCPDYVPFASVDEYVDLVCDAVGLVPDDVVIHRLTADAPRPILIAPEWSYKKRTILNAIERELKRRGN